MQNQSVIEHSKNLIKIKKRQITATKAHITASVARIKSKRQELHVQDKLLTDYETLNDCLLLLYIENKLNCELLSKNLRHLTSQKQRMLEKTKARERECNMLQAHLSEDVVHLQTEHGKHINYRNNCEKLTNRVSRESSNLFDLNENIKAANKDIKKRRKQIDKMETNLEVVKYSLTNLVDS